uniref:DDE Tnp4 domain-containing protein n=1 Tax=Anopheles minimus TaxID=112268 RepID=A0A182W805_9DIPT
HVRIKAPAKSGTQYFNYKKYFSVHLQAVADANCKFIVVDVGEYGSRSDSRVFNSSNFYELIRSNQLNIPPPKLLPGITISVPHVFVGNQGYPLKPFLIRPYPQTNTDPAVLIFNESLCLARRCVECAFGLLVAKWRCLKTELQLPSGITFKSLSFSFCMAHNTISSIVYETCEAIWSTLNTEFFPFPTTSTFKRVEKEFFDRWSFPTALVPSMASMCV